jgi:hypothetical protein
MQPRFTQNVSPSMTKLISYSCNEYQLQLSITGLPGSLKKMESSSRNISKTSNIFLIQVMLEKSLKKRKNSMSLLSEKTKLQ